MSRFFFNRLCLVVRVPLLKFSNVLLFYVVTVRSIE